MIAFQSYKNVNNVVRFYLKSNLIKLHKVADIIAMWYKYNQKPTLLHSENKDYGSSYTYGHNMDVLGFMDTFDYLCIF